jgi:hypothetical protein
MKIVGLMLGVALIGGVAYAAIPDAAGVYTACKLNALGTIRLIDPSGPRTSLLSHCTVYETQISWNQQGVPGAAGTNGTNGKDGVNGLAGTNGTNGAPCLPSILACVGPTGPAGAAGRDGTNGLPGKDGTDGLAGNDGANGAPGADGLSVTNTSLTPVANGPCPEGGSQFTVGGGTATYACNGKDGKDGTTGGTASPRDAYIVQSDNVDLSNGLGRSTVTSLTLPAGSWLVTARFDFLPATGLIVDCYLSGDDPTAADPYAPSHVFGRASDGPFENNSFATGIKHAASLEGAVTTDAAVTGVSLNCIGLALPGYGHFLRFFNIALSAVAVDNIHAIGQVTP